MESLTMALPTTFPTEIKTSIVKLANEKITGFD
jgi:hypothetical protein